MRAYDQRMAVDPLRISDLGGRIRPDGAHVLWWMSAHRRLAWNHALDHAVDLCRRLGKPLLILETKRIDHPWSSPRMHRFAVEGMRDHQRACAARGVRYACVVEREPGACRAAFRQLAASAAAVVCDRFPYQGHPALVADWTRGLDALTACVDANNLLPLAASPEAKQRAFDFRRLLQRSLAPHLVRGMPRADPLAELAGMPLAALPAGFASDDPAALLAVGFDGFTTPDRVGAGAIAGGREAALTTLRVFLAGRLDRYGEERSDPDADAASGLSPYLHWGHIGEHEVAHAVLARAGWDPGRLGTSTAGAKEGWWGVDASSESFLDELVTWRGLGFHFHHHTPDADRFEALPAWAQKTLLDHRADPRPHRYSPAQLEAADTHDRVWNAAQRQLVATGTMHNYLRMLWGKKVLEWSGNPHQAIATLFDLNNRYALDGCDPNSSSGIMWCFGRYDRPWAPVRPVFGCIRYMSSDNTVRKLKMKRYLEQWHA